MAKAIIVEILGNATQFAHELDKAAGTTRQFGAVATTAGLAVAGGLAFGLEQSVKAAVDAQDSQRRLEQAFKNVGLSATAYAAQIDAVQTSSRQLGFTDSEVRDSLGSLLTATRSVSASISDLSVAQDLARFKGVDLETATRILTQAMSGSQRAIRSLGVSISPVTTAVDALRRSHEDLSTAAGRADLAQAQLLDRMATGQAVIAATTALVKGQGEAYAQTAAGGMARFHAEVDHLEVAVGSTLLPALTALLNAINRLTASLTVSLGPSVASTREALGHLGVVATVCKDILIGLGLSIIGPVKLAITLLTAAIHAGSAAFNGLRTAAQAVAGFFAGVLRGAITGVHAVTSGLSSAVGGLHTAFNQVHSAASAVAGFLRGGLTGAMGAFRAVASGVSAVVHAIASALSAAAGAAHAFASALASIHVPHISLPHISLPHIPHFAAGVRNFTGGLAVVGEKGPELVNLPAGSGVIPSGVGGGDVYNFHFPNYVGSKDELVNAVYREFLRKQGRNTSLGLT